MTDAGSNDADSLVRFGFEHAAVRGSYVRLAKATSEILACHPYPPALARVMAELLAAAALLASTLKFSGSLIIQLQGKGPVRLMVVECDDQLDLRAMAQWDAVRVAALPADATLADLAGGPAQGRMSITLDPKGAGSLYQGIVALEGGSVAALIEHYLTTSEQVVSRIVLAVAGNVAAGMILQRLPGTAEPDQLIWARAREALAATGTNALLAATPAADRLATAFPEDDLRVFDARPARFRCRCNRERVETALGIAGREEVEAILAERDAVEITCEFCNHCYAFAPAEARAIAATFHGTQTQQ